MKREELILGERYYISYRKGELRNQFIGYGKLVSLSADGYPDQTLEVALENDPDNVKYGYFGPEDIVYHAPERLNLLKHIRIYLVGAMESEKDCGASWRNVIKDKLKDVNIRWFDPVSKVFVKDVQEAGEHQQDLKSLRAEGKFDELAKRMKEIRSYDLSMVDRSDAIIFYFDINTFTCGSWEELVTANRAKKPIFFICKQGVNNIPLWMFGMIPHKYFYNSIDEVVEILQSIDSGKKEIDSDRWRLLQEQYR